MKKTPGVWEYLRQSAARATQEYFAPFTAHPSRDEVRSRPSIDAERKPVHIEMANDQSYRNMDLHDDHDDALEAPLDSKTVKRFLDPSAGRAPAR